MTPEIMHITSTGEPCDDKYCDARHVRRPVRHRLDNDETWTTKDGQVLRYEDMTPRHRLNTLRMLLRQAPGLALSYWMRIWADPLLAPRGDMAQMDVERFEDETMADPKAWLLNDTRCGRRLHELVTADGNANRL